MKTMLRDWWSGAKTRMTKLSARPTVEEAYLTGAVDIADLERRLRRLERQSSEGALVRLRQMTWARP